MVGLCLRDFFYKTIVLNSYFLLEEILHGFGPLAGRESAWCVMYLKFSSVKDQGLLLLKFRNSVKLYIEFRGHLYLSPSHIFKQKKDRNHKLTT